QNDRKQIVEVVGYACGQQPDGAQFLTLLQPSFEQLLLCSVGYNPGDPFQFSVVVIPETADDLNVMRFACLPTNRAFQLQMAARFRNLNLAPRRWLFIWHNPIQQDIRAPANRWLRQP